MTQTTLTLETSFNQHQSIFLKSILTDLVKYVKEDIEFVNEQSVDLVVEKILNNLKINQDKPVSPPLPVALNALAKVTPGNVLAAPAAKKTSTTGKGGKAAKASQRNIPVDAYKIEFAQRKPICGYAPNRGDFNGTVCGGPASTETMKDPNPLSWRCVCCTGKKGIIDKHMQGTAVVGGQKPIAVVGFNTVQSKLVAPVLAPAPTLTKHHPASAALFGIMEPPSLNQLPTPPEDEDEPSIQAMQNETAPDYFFSNGEGKFGYVFIELGDDVVCVGKLLDEAGGPYVTSEDIVLPEGWQDSLQELDDDDQIYIKSIKTIYEFGKKPF